MAKIGKRMWGSVLVITLLTAVLFCTPVMAATIFEEDFESGSLSQWSVGGDPIVRIDEDGDGGHALYFAANGYQGGSVHTTFNVPQEYVLEARFMLPEAPKLSDQPSYYFNLSNNGWNDAAGTDDYVRVAFYPYMNDGAGAVQIFHKPDKDTKELYGEAVFAAQAGVWYNLRVEIAGVSVKVFFDDVLTVDGEMPRPLPAGKFGIGNWVPKVKVDDIVIKDLDGFDIRANGKSISSMADVKPGDTVSVSAYLPGDLQTKRTGALLVQLLNGDEPAGIAGASGAAEAGSLQSVKASLTLPQVESLDGYRLEIMLLDGYTTMNPLCDSLVIE